MTFKEIIIANLQTMSFDELAEIKVEIEKIITGNEMIFEVVKLLKNQQVLMAVKYVKDKTGWGLK